MLNLYKILICCALLIQASFAQTFTGGNQTNTLRWHAEAPWALAHCDSGYLRATVPLSISGQSPWSIPSQNANIRAISALSFESKIPLTPELRLWLDYLPRAAFQIGQETREDTIDYKGVTGSLNHSSNYAGAWNTLRLGALIHTPQRITIGLALESHHSQINASGNSSGVLDVQLIDSLNSNSIISEEHQIYEAAQFNSQWQALYQGHAWGARLLVLWKYFKYEGSLGRKVYMPGSINAQENYPVLVQANSYKIIDSLIDRNQVRNTNFSRNDSMIFDIPHSHAFTLRYKIIELTYIRQSTAYLVENMSSHADSALDYRATLSRTGAATHYLVSRIDYRWIGLTGGGMWLNAKPALIGSGEVRGSFKKTTLLGRLDILPWTRFYAGVEYAL